MLKAAVAGVAAAAAIGATAAYASEIVYTCDPNLCAMHGDGSHRRRLTTDGGHAYKGFPPGQPYEGISMSRDGSTLGFARADDTFVADRNARHRRRLDFLSGPLDLHPDGNRWMWFGNPETSPRWCRGTLRPLHYSCRVLYRAKWDYPAWGPGGSLLTTDTDTGHTICTTRVDKRHVARCKHVLVHDPARSFFLMPSVSPDGKLLATTIETADGTAIAIYDLRSGHFVRRLTSGRQYDVRPAWSPDGRYVAFPREYRDGHVAVVRARVSGGDVRDLVRRDDGIGEVAWGG